MLRSVGDGAADVRADHCGSAWILLGGGRRGGNETAHPCVAEGAVGRAALRRGDEMGSRRALIPCVPSLFREAPRTGGRTGALVHIACMSVRAHVDTHVPR